MKFDYSYLGAQLLITAVGHSITQQPLQMSAVAVRVKQRWGETRSSLRRTSEMSMDVHTGNGLARPPVLQLLPSDDRRIIRLCGPFCRSES